MFSSFSTLFLALSIIFQLLLNIIILTNFLQTNSFDLTRFPVLLLLSDYLLFPGNSLSIFVPGNIRN